ncbi:MAG: MFS transporter, partial [Terriglobales bacterium]
MAQERSWRRGYWSLIATQFQGAFSDNALKNLIFYLALGAGMAEGRLVLVVGLLFSAPFLLFSMYGGYLADRWSKRTVTIATKIMELGVALLAGAALLQGSLGLLFAALFLISTQAALFSPTKYGLLPELLPEGLLSWWNGVLEMSTFVAIILGTAVGAWLSDAFRARPGSIGMILLAGSILGLLASTGISRVPPADRERRLRLNFPAEVMAELRAVYPDRVLWLAIVGNTWFWFYAALMNFNIPLFANDVLGAGHTQAAFLVAVQAVGIGLGSLAAGYLSGGKIEPGLIPFGCLGVLGAGAALGGARLGYYGVLLDLVALGFFAGFIAVPINALMQHRPAPEQRGKVLALQSFLSFCGIAAASGVYSLLRFGLDTRATFLALAGLTLLGTVWALYLLPEAFLRFLLWVGAHTLYRMKVEGQEHVPRRGGALLVANHVSWVDALLLSVACTRRIRFLAYQDLFQRPILGRLLRLARAIPIAARQHPRELAASLRAAAESIRTGSLVCIFGEGQITRTGNLLPFRRGMERIMRAAGEAEAAEAPIIPVCVDGLWGSLFSFERRRFFWKLPRRLPYPIQIHFGAPLPADASVATVREAVQRLQSRAWDERVRRLPRLERSWRATARRHPWRTAMYDQRAGRLRLGAVLVKTVFLARRLQPRWQAQETVGILLPPSVGAALA